MSSGNAGLGGQPDGAGTADGATAGSLCPCCDSGGEGSVVNSFLAIALVIAVVFPAAWWWQRRESRAVAAALESIAERRGGRLRQATALRYPQLTFSQLGVEILVSAMSGSGPTNAAHSFVQAHLAHQPDFTFVVSTRSVGAAFAGWSRSTGVATEDADFDGCFVVRSSDERRLLTIFDADVRNHLGVLAQDRHVWVVFAPATLFEEGRLVTGQQQPRLSVSVGGIVTDAADYDRMTDVALLLLDRIERTG